MLIESIYATENGKTYPYLKVLDKIAPALSLPLNSEVMIAGIVQKNEIRYTKRKKPYRRITIEYRDGTYTHNVFEKVDAKKFDICLFFAEIDSYNNAKELRIRKVEKLIDTEEYKRRFLN